MPTKKKAAATTPARPVSKRRAQISVGLKGQSQTVRVAYSGQLSAREITRINDTLINSVIKDLTGCACLSGIIDVIYEPIFDRVIDVQLG